MALKARGFPRAPARKQRAGDAQDYKVALLKERFPDADVGPFALALYMVDVRSPRATRVLLKDGAWVEADDESGTVSLWGPRSASAAALAEAISASTGYGVDHLARTAAAGKPGRGRRKAAMAEAEAISLADRWRRRGFHDVSESPAGVRINVGGRSRLLDSGDHVDVVGPITDEALRALAGKASEDWGGSLRLDGPWPEEAIGRLWMECRRQGVELADYTPSPELLAAWAPESGSVTATETRLRAIRSETREANLLLSAAAGDVAALRKLELPLRAFIASHLDDDQRADLAKADREDVTASLPAFRKLGCIELGRDPKAATGVDRPTADTAPADEYERRPA